MSVREMSARTGLGVSARTPIGPPVQPDPAGDGSGRAGSRDVPLKDGTVRSTQYGAAPQSVKDAFWAELRKATETERDFSRWLSELNSDDPVPPRQPLTLSREVRWDESWARRARAVRKAMIAPRDDWTSDRDEDPLVDIPTRVYVEALTGEEVPASGNIRCPLPDHDDRNPSFRCFDGQAWRCYGCGCTGTIYDLAGYLWDLEPRGRNFVEIHKRLRAVFA